MATVGVKGLTLHAAHVGQLKWVKQL